MSPRRTVTEDLVRISRELGRRVGALTFGPPVAHVYNPLDYARVPHEEYLRYGSKGCQVLLVGMNPGPWGMMQTGVPFGEVSVVRDWLGIEADIVPPARQHPQRPITGFACHRSEVSGQRLWGWARGRFGTVERCFARLFVWNYCPLAFLEATGRNRTPDKLSPVERQRLFAACDEAMRATIELLEPKAVVGVGKFAEDRVRAVMAAVSMAKTPRIGGVLHPSPASPLANAGWSAKVDAQLAALGLEL